MQKSTGLDPNIIAYGWLESATPELLEEVVRLSVIKTLSSGQYLHSRGDTADGYHFLIEGKMRISAEDSSGNELLLTLINPGSWFGEISLLDHLPRTHHAISSGESKVLMLPKQHFYRMVEETPQVLSGLARQVCSRLRLAMMAIEEATLLPLPSRLAKKLLYLSQANDVSRIAQPPQTSSEVILRLTQQDLAHMLGVSRQSVSKLLQQWSNRGVLTLDYNRIVLKDIPALTSLAGESTVPL